MLSYRLQGEPPPSPPPPEPPPPPPELEAEKPIAPEPSDGEKQSNG